MTHRIDKINDLIRDHVAMIIGEELTLKQGVFVSILRVDTSKDLRYSRIFVSIFPETDRPYALKTLEKETFKIQGKLNEMLTCNPLPRIEFVSDETEAKVDELEKVFEKIRKERL